MFRTQSQIKSRKNICKLKNTWSILCQNLWNWSIFYERYKELIKVDKNGHDYILFNIDIYFSEHELAVQIDEKGKTDRDLIFQKKKTRSTRKKYSIVNLLELISTKKIMMQIMKLVEYKHSLLNQLKN